MTSSALRVLAVLLSLAPASLSASERTGHDSLVACAPGLNPVVCENFQPGAPASEWDVSGSGDPSIQGFATEISVDQGETVRFKINTPATSYRLDIYRLGYYGGLGARKIASVAPSASLPQTQPACQTQAATGLVDCGNWAESASWAVPADAVSGIHLARLVRADTGGASHIVFIVRDDDGGSDILFQTADTTWQAYNSYGGNSLYTGAPAGRAYKVSYNRPFNTRGLTDGGTESWLFNSEYPMVRWLEANGYDVSYFTGVDADRRAAEILEHRIFVSVGHDEYWSGQQRANVEAARDAGVHLAFFSGNEVFWKTRWESDASGRSHRTLVCYKETHNNAKIDPSPEWTGTWRDPRFSPPSDGGRPENALTGTLFMVNAMRADPITVSEAEGKLRFWRNTDIAALQPGQSANLPAGTLGYEWNIDPDNGFRPAGLMRLSSTTIDVTPVLLQNYGSTYGFGVATHHLTLHRHASGALVFGAGTVQWSWGLDAVHDRPGPAADVRMQQATVNLFADMGVQPFTLQAGLVAASATNDTARPSSAITAPAAGSTVQAGGVVTISGTAHDDGGAVAGVEVSTDGGVTWHAAEGRATWTYAWIPFTPGLTAGSATLLSRAVDDSGNIEIVGPAVTVSVTPGPGLVAAYGFEEGSGPTAVDRSPNGNDATLSGATWTPAGRFGGALSFDGVDDWATVADSASLDLTAAMTLEAWVYPTALGGWRTAIMKEAANGLAYSLYANEELPRASAYVRVGTAELPVTGVTPLPLDAWTHLAATYDGAQMGLFVNGTLVTSFVLDGSIATTAAPLRLGGNALWGEYFQGRIDEVRIYSRALTAAQIKSDMSTAVGGTPLPDTTPPAVALTAPQAGAIVKGTITIAADASDNRAVAGVQWLLDGTPLLGEDTAAPYSAAWDSTLVGDGQHQLSARARDEAGNATVSAPVTITIANAPDTTPPTVAIAAPASGATVSGVTPITANAADNAAVAGVVFLVDGVALGAEDTSAPYSTAWNTALVSNGQHTVSARARDAAGNLTTSAAVSVLVSNSQTGLVAAYSFDEGVGTIVSDASGNGRTATISGAAWSSAGRFGGALSFDGVNDWATVADANPLDLTTGMTLEAWVRPSALTGWRTVLMKEAGAGLSYALMAHDNAPHPAATINVTTDKSANGTSALPLNAWSHLAATYDGAVLRLYVNAVQVGTRAISGPMAVSASPLRMGGNAPWGEYFQGLLDEVRIFNRARTAAEIQSDMMTPIDAVVPDTIDSQPPSTPAGLTAAPGSGTVSLGWSASSDNRGVTHYNVHRGTAAGFTPGASNRIGQPATPAFTDAPLAAGTYYYRVTAQDAAGNISGPSNEASATVAAAPPPPAGLVAAYGFDEGTGTTSTDASGNGLVATVSGATWTAAGRFGAALAFDGVDDWVTVADAGALDLTTGMTLEAWVNPSALTDWRTALLKEAPNGLAYALYAHDNAPRPAVTVNAGGLDWSSGGTTALALNSWSHLAATYDGTTLRLFVNGAAISSVAVGGGLTVSGGALRIGGNAVWGEYFQGLIDEVRIYNRALTPSEIQADMQRAVGGS